MIDTQKLRHALEQIRDMDWPIEAESPKDYQAMLYHRMRQIAQEALDA